MKLLSTITSYLPAIGGAQNHTHEVNKRINGNHAEVKVFSFWDTHRTDWLRGTTLAANSEPKAYSFEGVPVSQAFFSAAEKVRMIPPFLFYYPFMHSAAQSISRFLDNQLEACEPSPDLVHNSRIGRAPLSLASLNYARRKGVPFVLTPYHHPRWVGWRYQVYLNIYRDADKVIVLTRNEAEILEALGIPEDRISVTGMGAVVEEGADGRIFREKHAIGDSPIVLFVGQQYKYKGVGVLVNAFAQIQKDIPDCFLVLVGPQTEYSRVLFKGVSNKNILNLGKVSFEEKCQAYSACDVFCLPSQQESFGGVFAEAWAYRKPVVGCKIPAVEEVIDHGENGYLVNPLEEQIAQALILLLKDGSLSAKFGLNGNQKMREFYTWEVVTRRTLDVYQSL